MIQYPRIREARKAKHLTQAALAAKAGIAEITVRKYEAGHRSPTVVCAKQLARALNVSLDWLLTEAPAEINAKSLSTSFQAIGEY